MVVRSDERLGAEEGDACGSACQLPLQFEARGALDTNTAIKSLAAALRNAASQLKHNSRVFAFTPVCQTAGCGARQRRLHLDEWRRLRRRFPARCVVGLGSIQNEGGGV